VADATWWLVADGPDGPDGAGGVTCRVDAGAGEFDGPSPAAGAGAVIDTTAAATTQADAAPSNKADLSGRSPFDGLWEAIGDQSMYSTGIVRYPSATVGICISSAREDATSEFSRLLIAWVRAASWFVPGSA